MKRVRFPARSVPPPAPLEVEVHRGPTPWTRAAHTAATYQMIQGLPAHEVPRDMAPCPRCGMELRAGTVGARRHDRTQLVWFCIINDGEITQGYRCRI